MSIRIGRRHPELSSQITQAVQLNPPTDWTLEGISQYVADLHYRFYSETTTCVDVYLGVLNRVRKMKLPIPKMEDRPSHNAVNRRAREILRMSCAVSS